MKLIYRISTGVAVAHLVLLLVSSVPVAQNERAWVWMIWLFIDFPVSLFVLLGWEMMVRVWGDISWYGTMKATIHELWPFFVHGVLGTVWWYFLTLIVGKTYIRVIGVYARYRK